MAALEAPTQAQVKPRTVEESLADDSKYSLNHGIIQLNKGPEGEPVSLARVGDDGQAEIVYGLNRDLYVYVMQSKLVGHLRNTGGQPRETLSTSLAPDLYAEAANELLVLANRLRPQQDRMVTKELPRGQQ